MPITKDEQYVIYNLGITDGKHLISDSVYSTEDVLELALRKVIKGNTKRVNNSTPEEFILAVKNYMDGLEDGCKSQISHESDKYVKWLKEQM